MACLDKLRHIVTDQVDLVPDENSQVVQNKSFDAIDCLEAMLAIRILLISLSVNQLCCSIKCTAQHHQCQSEQIQPGNFAAPQELHCKENCNAEAERQVETARDEQDFIKDPLELAEVTLVAISDQWLHRTNVDESISS